jgi:membrane protease YdiL (CAAX protease family)
MELMLPEEESRPEPPSLPAGLLPLAIGGIVAASACAFVLAAIVGGLLDIRGIGAVVAVGTVLYGALLVVVRRVWERTGRGSLRDTFGFAFEPTDVGRGALVMVLSLVAASMAIAPFADNERLRGSNTDLIEHFRHDVPAYVVIVLLVVVVAPVVEELYFRGVVLRVLNDAVGTRWSVFTQGVLFGAVHIDPFAGTHNVTVVVAVTAMGWVLGWSANRYRRLGPGIVGHALRNGLTVAILFFT